MNNQLIKLQLPLDLIKLMVAQLPLEGKKEVAKVLTEPEKIPPLKSLKGFLKGLVVQDQDFEEAEKSLFRHSL